MRRRPRTGIWPLACSPTTGCVCGSLGGEPPRTRSCPRSPPRSLRQTRRSRRWRQPRSCSADRWMRASDLWRSRTRVRVRACPLPRTLRGSAHPRATVSCRSTRRLPGSWNARSDCLLQSPRPSTRQSRLRLPRAGAFRPWRSRARDVPVRRGGASSGGSARPGARESPPVPRDHRPCRTGAPPRVVVVCSRAVQCATEAVRLAERHGWSDEPVAGVAYMVVGGGMLMHGRFEDAETWLVRAERTLHADAKPAAGGCSRWRAAGMTPPSERGRALGLLAPSALKRS